jgi:hypothetical protein
MLLMFVLSCQLKTMWYVIDPYGICTCDYMVQYFDMMGSLRERSLINWADTKIGCIEKDWNHITSDIRPASSSTKGTCPAGNCPPRTVIRIQCTERLLHVPGEIGAASHFYKRYMSQLSPCSQCITLIRFYTHKLAKMWGSCERESVFVPLGRFHAISLENTALRQHSRGRSIQ